MLQSQNNSKSVNYSTALAMLGSQNELNHSLSKTIIQSNKSEMVDARKLWNWLGVKSQFSDWVKSRIKTYGFTENVDYVSFQKFLKRADRKGATVKIEYHISFDMAKEVSMLETNAKGREARLYYIRVEKIFKQFLSKTHTPINGILPIYHNGKLGYPRKQFLISIGRSYRNGYRLRKRFPEDCFAIGNTSCISSNLAHLLQDEQNLKNRALQMKSNQLNLPL